MSDEVDLDLAKPEMLPGNPAFETALAQGQYEFAQTRFVRAITSEGVAKIVEGANRKRAALRTEIDNLRVLVRMRHQDAIEQARIYGSVLPHRVGRTWMQPPTQLEKVGAFHGSERLYKKAVRATKDYTEVRELLVKKREQLIKLEQGLRDQLGKREAALLEEVTGGRGLQIALQRDPLLKVAYDKLKLLQGELATPPPLDGLGDL